MIHMKAHIKNETCDKSVLQQHTKMRLMDALYQSFRVLQVSYSHSMIQSLAFKYTPRGNIHLER